MFSILRTRHSAYFNFAFLFAIFGLWLFFYLQPVLRGFISDEYLFYGKVSYAAIPSIFGNTNIPFLDKTTFQINNDKEATFTLYASSDMLDEMSEWFSFGAKNISNISLEVTASRVAENRFVVSSMATSDGSMEWDNLMGYQFYWAIVYLGIELLLFILFIIFMIKGIKSRHKYLAFKSQIQKN